MKEVNPHIVAQINARMFNLQVHMLKGNELKFFKELEALVKRYESESEIGSFVVGKAFHFQDSGYSEPFLENIAIPHTELVIPINLRKLRSLREWIAPVETTSFEIREAIKVKPFSIQMFWLILYLLTVRKDLGKLYLGYELVQDKFYLLHVQINSSIYSVGVHRDNSWDFSAWFETKGHTSYWPEGAICLF